VFVTKAMLNYFELASGVKVNFMKSYIGEVGCSQHLLQHCASILNCKIMKTPFKYLGMLVGGVIKKGSFWEGVSERVRNRLGR